MTDEDVPRSPELQALLGQARKASPPRARLESVRARLESELGPLGPPAGPPDPPAHSAPPASQTPSWLAPAGAVVVLAIALLAIVARPTSVAPPAPSLPREPSHAASGAHESPENVGVSSDPAGAAPTQEVAPLPEVAPEPAAAERTTRTSPRAPRGGASNESREGLAPGQAEAGEDEAARASQLREELSILERAMSQRRAGDLEGTRAAIAEHARRFPRGLLAPERERLASELE